MIPTTNEISLGSKSSIRIEQNFTNTNRRLNAKSFSKLDKKIKASKFWNKAKTHKSQASNKAITHREHVMNDAQFNDLKRSVYDQKNNLKSKWITTIEFVLIKLLCCFFKLLILHRHIKINSSKDVKL